MTIREFMTVLSEYHPDEEFMFISETEKPRIAVIHGKNDKASEEYGCIVFGMNWKAYNRRPKSEEQLIEDEKVELDKQLAALERKKAKAKASVRIGRPPKKKKAKKK